MLILQKNKAVETKEIKAKGTVTIDIEVYDELMDIKKGLFWAEYILIDFGYYNQKWRCYHADGVNKMIANANEEYRNKVEELTKALHKKEEDIKTILRSKSNKEIREYNNKIVI